MEIRVIDCDAIVGFVDYGTIDSEKNGGYSTKMRCKKCGAAWLICYFCRIERTVDFMHIPTIEED